MDVLLLAWQNSGSEMQPLDLQRMLTADLPWAFAIEVILRSVLVFTFAVLALRMLGKRGVANLSPFEFAILLAFGSLIGDPTFYHEVGLVFAIVAVMTIVLMYRFFAWLMMRSEKVAHFAESGPRQLVKDGVIDVQGEARERLPRGDLFAMLRQSGITQLGEVRTAYLETSGRLSVFRHEPEQVRRGLRIEPPSDLAKPTKYHRSDTAARGGHFSCTYCALTVEQRDGEPFSDCSHCGHCSWVAAAEAMVRTTVMTDGSPIQ
jgi:uncharacterized membrane protein YcaP (DUF421 family)